MNTKVVDVKFINKKQIGIAFQILFSILFVIFGVLYLINKSNKIIFYIILSLLLLSTAFNNHIIYKRKYMTLIYLISGLIVFVMALKEVIL